MSYTYLGELDEAARRFQRYKRLSPMDPHAFFFEAGMIILELLRRDYETAAAIGRRASELNPSFTAGLKYYLISLGHLGLQHEAATVRRRLLAIEPDFTMQKFLSHSPLDRASDREHFAEGLRLSAVLECVE